MYSTIPNTKLMKKHKQLAIVCNKLEQIKSNYENEIYLSYSELAFLQEHQDIIKKIYTDDPVLWELAGIPESEWNNRK